MQEHKTIRRYFAPWEFDIEAAELDDMSRHGWQLAKATRRKQEYVYDDTVQYRYALDFQIGPREPDYLPMFTDQGWEAVSVIESMGFWRDSRWYFFRKRYDPALPEEAYQVYTDSQSLGELKKRINQTLGILGILGIWYLIEFFLFHSAYLLIPGLIFCVSSLINLRKKRSLKQAQLHGPRRRRIWPHSDTVCVIAAIALTVICGTVHDNTIGSLYSGPAETATQVEFTVTLPDWYTLDTSAIGNAGVFYLTNESGKTLASGPLIAGRDYKDNQYGLFLWPGTYTITTDTQAGAVPGTPMEPVQGEINYFLR